MDLNFEAILVRACVQLLKPDEGIIIHFEDEVYAVYYNSSEEALKIVQEPEYDELEHGRLIWMHYEGSQAPTPGFNEEVFCDPDSKTKH